MSFKIRQCVIATTVMIFIMVGGQSSAQNTAEAPAAFEIPKQEQPFWDSAQRFLDAYAARDTKALGELFTENAEFLDELGVRSIGREAIVERFQQAFDESPEALLESVQIQDVRYIGDSVAVEEGTVLASLSADAPRVENRYAAIHHKGDDGVWRIAILKDFPRRDLGREEQLAQLNWMIGDWVNEDSQNRVHTSCRPSPDGNFLLREFNVLTNDGREMSGTQRIGWDPIHKKLRSWTFDSEGGFFSGFWNKTADGWLMTSSGVNAAGETVTSTAIYRIIDSEMLIWQFENLIIGDEVIGAGQPITMVRRPPSPAIDEAAAE